MSDKFPGGFLTAGAPAGFSVAFDGTGDYLSGVPSTAYDFGTSEAYSVEFWAYLNSVPSSFAFTGGNTTGAFGINYDTGGGYLKCGKAGVGNQLTTSYVLSSGQWYHIVFCRQSGTLSAFVNGTRVATTSDSTSYTATTGFIGGDTSFASMNGYLSNFRIVTGASAYNPSATTLTVPTQLFPITNTAILTCQSPTIIDNSGNAVTLTANGDAKVSNFTPFAAYTGFNPALGAAAGGVWTIDEAAYYQNNRQWPIYDPYFNQTTLMLHGNGTNAAQNNTFLDSSTNNFTITRNGNTAQGTFSPFSQTGWSNYFDGTDDRLITSTALFVYSTGSASTQTATVEAMVYLNAYNAAKASIGENAAIVAKGSTYMNFGINDTGKVFLYHYDGSVRTTVSAGSVSLNTWTHVAFTLSAGVITLYINGVAQSLSSGSSTWYGLSVTSGSSYIGESTDASSSAINGYLSNIRVSTIARTITVPTAPLVADTSTVFLTSQSNRFIDNSANNYAVTVDTGTPSVQAFSPFVPAYITPTTYSNYVGTTASYLTVTSQPLINVADWTVEFWVYPTQFNNNGGVFGASNGGGTNPKLYFYCSSTNLQLTYYSGGFTTILTNPTPTLNKWTYVSVSRSSSTGNAYLYYDGILQQTATAAAITGITGGFTLFSDGEGSASAFYGCMSNARVSNIARYTGTSYTPPSTPSVNSANTTLLTCQSSTIIDNSSNTYTIATTGTILPVTSPTPFPAKVDTTTLNSAYSTSLIGGSGYFDGTGDYLNTPSSANLAFGTGDFTVDFWIYATSLPASDNNILNQNLASGTPQFYIDSSGKLQYRNAFVGAILTSNTTFKSGQWYYCAISRASGTSRMFINGALDTSGADTTNWSNTAGWYVSNNTGPFTGYIAGSRLIKGTALYTSAFAPPLTPPTAITNTQLLLNYTNAGIIDNAAKNVLETVGNAQISTTQSKWGGGSMYFDGTGDYATTFSNSNFTLGTGDFTVECWFNASGLSGQTVLVTTAYPTDQQGFFLGFNNNTVYYLLGNGTWIANPNSNPSSPTISTGAWYHIALVRSGSVFTVYLNGTSISTVTSTVSLTNSNNQLCVGSRGTANYFNGYIDDMRITKGVARYVTNFTPPTSQLQDQ